MRIYLLLFLICTPLLAQESKLIEVTLTPEGAKELQLPEPYITGSQVRMNRREVVISRSEGKTARMYTIPRSEILSLKFIPAPAAARLDSKPSAAALPGTPATLGGGDSNIGALPATNENLRQLSDPQARAQFRQIQAQMMGPYAGRPGYAEALAQQNDLYEKLASGAMNLSELKKLASSVSAKAESYNAEETAAYPELPELLKPLHEFINSTP